MTLSLSCTSKSPEGLLNMIIPRLYFPPVTQKSWEVKSSNKCVFVSSPSDSNLKPGLSTTEGGWHVRNSREGRDN